MTDVTFNGIRAGDRVLYEKDEDEVGNLKFAEAVVLGVEDFSTVLIEFLIGEFRSGRTQRVDAQWCQMKPTEV